MSDRAIRNITIAGALYYLVSLAGMEWVLVTDPSFDGDSLPTKIVLTVVMGPILACGPAVPYLVGVTAYAAIRHHRTLNVPRETSTEETS